MSVKKKQSLKESKFKKRDNSKFKRSIGNKEKPFKKNKAFQRDETEQQSKGKKVKPFKKRKSFQRDEHEPHSKGKKVKSFKKRKAFQPDESDPHSKVETEEDIESATSDEEEEYEKVPRISKEIKVRHLLPVKNKHGLKFRSEVVPDSDPDEEPEDNSKKKSKPSNLIESYAVQQQKLNELKRKVALICTSLIEDPENNMVALKELISLLQNPSTKMIISEKKILCFSLLHVFSDILPGYKIRLPDEKEKGVKLKKDTKKLLGYEQTLLKCYKKFVDLLYDLIRKMKSTENSPSASFTLKKASIEIGLVALKCMCQLLSSRYSFNYFKNIVNKLVPVAIDGKEEVTTICCQAFKKMFKADKLGEASFDLVKQLVNVIKQRNFKVPPAILRSFLSLNLREAKPEVEKVDMGKGRKEWQKMSRTQRRDKKKTKDLEAELKETQAYESVETVKKFHTATLNKIFWVFFHILKDGDKMSLIAPSLEALSKFAYLINLEFFDDLNSVLCGMMESGKLSDVEKLHGVYTLFTILAGQAESLHIDPHRIYCHMYQGLWNLSHATDVDHFDLTLKCLEFNILRKKKRISPIRILAFIKRVCTISLQTPVHGTLGLLSSVRNLLLNVKGADVLLDSESNVGSGFYVPDMEDPEHCNPQSTALWELHLLKKHYNPAIKLFSQYLLLGCQNVGRVTLPEKLQKSTPEEILHLFADIAVNNKMDHLEDNETPPKKKFKIANVSDLFWENDTDSELNTDVIHDDINIFC